MSGLGDDCVAIHLLISGVVTALRLRTQANGSVLVSKVHTVALLIRSARLLLPGHLHTLNDDVIPSPKTMDTQRGR